MLFHYIHLQMPEIIEENVVTWVSQTFRGVKYLNTDFLFLNIRMLINFVYGHQNVISAYL